MGVYSVCAILVSGIFSLNESCIAGDARDSEWAATSTARQLVLARHCLPVRLAFMLALLVLGLGQASQLVLPKGSCAARRPRLTAV